MKRFLKRVLIICIAPTVLFLIFNILYYKLGNSTRMSAFEVYEAIDIAGTSTGCTTLVLGDSVGRQFFNSQDLAENNECCYLATNQAITVAGNSVLLQRFLENNPNLDRVYYVLRPDSLCGGVNFIYTYSYFVTPLFGESYNQYLYPETIEGIEDVFGKVCAEKWFPKWMMAKYPKILEMYNNTCASLWQLQQKVDETKHMPDMSITYLAQMNRICNENEIELHLVCVPLPEEYIFDSDSLKTEMYEAGLETLYEEYISDLQYVEQSAFVDGIHLTREYMDTNRAQFVRRVLR